MHKEGLNGAATGNRTQTFSLEDYNATVEHHSRWWTELLTQSAPLVVSFDTSTASLYLTTTEVRVEKGGFNRLGQIL